MSNTSDNLNSALSLLNGNTAMLDGMATWDTARRLAFVQTLQERGNVHAVLAMLEVNALLHIAQSRHFISDKHLQQIREQTAKQHYNLHNWQSLLQYNGYVQDYCGRSRSELEQIAEDSAKAIAKNLPKLADAVRVIDKATAAKIDKAHALRAELDQHEKTLKTLTEPQILTEYAKENPKATVSEFVNMIETRAQRAKALVETMNKIGKQGSELQKEIDKALYEGLPGLSEAVVELAVEKIKSVSAMPQMMRRVSETVQFGDSVQATTMLSTFEKDELQLDESIKEKFKNAMDKLRSAAKGLSAPTKTTKALPKKRTRG